LLHTAAGWAIATADAPADPTQVAPSPFVYTVSLYTIAADGTVARIIAMPTTLLPTGLAAADLNGDGRDDLVVASSLENTLRAASKGADGSFAPPPPPLRTGITPSAIAAVDVNGDGLLDLVVSDQASGDVSVFLNDPGHTFARSFRFRAGTGLYSLDSSTASPAVSSLEQSFSLAAGAVTGPGRHSHVARNR